MLFDGVKTPERLQTQQLRWFGFMDCFVRGGAVQCGGVRDEGLDHGASRRAVPGEVAAAPLRTRPRAQGSPRDQLKQR